MTTFGGSQAGDCLSRECHTDPGSVVCSRGSLTVPDCMPGTIMSRDLSCFGHGGSVNEGSHRGAECQPDITSGGWRFATDGGGIAEGVDGGAVKSSSSTAFEARMSPR